MGILKRFQLVLDAEAEAIRKIPVNDSAIAAVTALLDCRGKVFTTGIGKAGYIARKAASTFSTTGSPAAFLHPADASHGDVGAVTRGDVLLAFSNSGETREVIETVKFCRALGVETVIAITSHGRSTMGELSDIVLEIGVVTEPCPLELTPTASTTAMIALTDALALTVMEQRGFTKHDFAVRHHGGYLGAKSREPQG